MGIFKKLFGRTPAEPMVPNVEEQQDGSVTHTYTFELSGDNQREVRDDVVAALDAAMGQHGEVLHAIDASRMVRFDAGGPPVWSIGFTTVHGETSYWLWVTYGLSGVVTPVDYRDAFACEYSIAVPCDGSEPPAWPAALLTHVSRYVLRSRAELSVGDNMPCWEPITHFPFGPEHHADLPMTALDTLLAARDPLLGSVGTPYGDIEIRRLVGLLPDELRLLQRWSSTSFVTEMTKHDRHLLTDLTRPSLLSDPAFSSSAIAKAKEEGSSLGVLFVELEWQATDDGAVIQFPGGDNAALIKEILAARLPFGRPLILQGPESRVVFEPNADFAMAAEGDTFYFCGSHDDPHFLQVLSAISEDEPSSTLQING